MSVFFTSDQHFQHKNIIKYCNRPFSNVEEMNEVLVENHNKMVTNKDIVYHLGDFCFGGNPKKWLDRLNGKKHYLILGNHDHRHKKELRKIFDNVDETGLVTVGNDLIYISHYAHLVWPQVHYGVYHLFGHSHGNLKGVTGSLDCGVDPHGFMPIEWDDLKDVIDNEKSMLEHNKDLMLHGSIV